MRQKNTGKNTGARTGPIRDALGRVSGGNPGNTGGKPGRSGRPKTAFKKFCRELSATEEYQDAIKEAATDADHDNFIGAAKLVATFATAKPAQKVNHTGDLHLHVSSARQRLADQIARLAQRN